MTIYPSPSDLQLSTCQTHILKYKINPAKWKPQRQCTTTMTFYETSPPSCMPANWSHTYSRTISDSTDSGPSSIKTTVTQPQPQINVHQLLYQGNQDRGPLSLLSASFGHPLAAYTPLNSPFPGELDNANNLHLLLWMIAPPRCMSLLSSCVCDLLQNMGNHKSPYPLAGAIRQYCYSS